MRLTNVTLSVSPFGLPPPPMGEARALLRRSNQRSINDPLQALMKNFQILFTFFIVSCIVMGEQSRRPRVKCHWDGELPGGRRNFPRWGHRTRCCIMDILLYVATILGRANGRLYTCCPSPRVFRDLSKNSLACFAPGLLRFTGRWGSICASGSSPAF